MKNDMPEVRIKLFASIRRVFEENEILLEVQRLSNIRELLELICNTYERRQRIFDHFGQIRPNITILKNGRHIDFLSGFETQLEEGDQISIFPLICGG